MKAIYPGSFDPVTYGHIDIIERASKVVDELIIGVLVNSEKHPMFSIEERIALLEQVTGHLSNVSVKTFDGLTVEFCKINGANLIIRGLRAVTDFETEMQIAQTNHSIEPTVDTMFFTTSLEYSYLSSSSVKTIISFGGDISQFVPEFEVPLINAKFSDKGK